MARLPDRLDTSASTHFKGLFVEFMLGFNQAMILMLLTSYIWRQSDYGNLEAHQCLRLRFSLRMGLHLTLHMDVIA